MIKIILFKYKREHLRICSLYDFPIIIKVKIRNYQLRASCIMVPLILGWGAKNSLKSNQRKIILAVVRHFIK